MDFIVNPTNACNFACEFCAAANLKRGKLTAEETISIISRIAGRNTIGGIIINGGDPLMMDPQYYLELDEWLSDYSPRSFISLTTNLLDFYRNPGKWAKLFSRPRVGVITSFQYGNKRRYKLPNGEIKVYEEDLFLEIENKFKDMIGYTPGFIYVVDYDNEPYIMKAVELAKKLNTICKINKVEVCGRNTEYYPYYRILEKYIEIISTGLMQYEMNSKFFYDFFINHKTRCPLLSNCQKTITVINPDKTLSSCSYIADNYDKEIPNTYMEVIGNKLYRKTYNSNLRIKDACLACENYMICNSCNVKIKEALDNDDTETYCSEMKRVVPILKEVLMKNV